MLRVAGLCGLIVVAIAPLAQSNPAAELTAAEETIHFCWQSRWHLRTHNGPRDAAFSRKVQEMQQLCTQAWHLTQESMAQGQVPYNGTPLPQAYPFDPPLRWFTQPPQVSPSNRSQ